jgi:hypothetical protein
MVGMNLFGHEARNRKKTAGFQSFATLLPVKFIRSRREAKTASACGVKALNRAKRQLFALFLAAHRLLPRHCSLFYEGMT